MLEFKLSKYVLYLKLFIMTQLIDHACDEELSSGPDKDDVPALLSLPAVRDNKLSTGRNGRFCSWSLYSGC